MKKKVSNMYCDFCHRKCSELCTTMLELQVKENSGRSSKSISIPSKHYLYHQGEQLDNTYILREGWILLTKVTEKGEREVVRSVLPGDLLGFQPDLQGPSDYSAIAIQDSIVCTTPDIMKMCRQHPEFALKLIWIEACEISLAQLYMTNIAHQDAHGKIAFMALELFQRLKYLDLNKGNVIPFPLTQEDIADTLGLTPIHVNRTLQALEKDKLIRLHKHKLKILDYKKLNALVGIELKPFEKCCILEEGSNLEKATCNK